ncbi:MAG: hypothetical protein H6883_07760 [Rhodobiaceae bacterium]|nr:hypothetical protein [Rhodobiaceae bacterium]MCC0056016.1 hypothetical protein [Rhodobiaceae bacterium]
MFKRTLVFGVAIAAAAASYAFADSYAGGAVMTMKGDKGEVLTDAKGMSLYTFDKDSAGATVCYDQCAINWPPLMATSGAKAEGDFSLVTRKDGAMQWAYKGQPLYLWKNDKKPGDMTGDGVGGVWHLAKD